MPTAIVVAALARWLVGAVTHVASLPRRGDDSAEQVEPRTMASNLDGRVALVTGGGRGIGRAISLSLAEDGADVALTYNRDEESAAATVKEIEALGRRAVALQGAVESLEDDERCVASAQGELGPIDILVNNAGIASKGRAVVDTDPEETSRLLAAHAVGPHHLCRLVLPAMRERERGDIVFISSVATDSMAANGAPYNMGKAAMEALAATLAKEERRYGIHVNVVAPGLVETEMGRRLVRAGGVTDMRTLDAVMPYGRVCQPEDIADAVRYLVSDGASYVTGQKIRVHGGGQ
jgi:3-oxoacyl-[acyl-carrier protein] reductase